MVDGGVLEHVEFGGLVDAGQADAAGVPVELERIGEIFKRSVEFLMEKSVNFSMEKSVDLYMEKSVDFYVEKSVDFYMEKSVVCRS
jgi:hypothetical protein